jgi:6-phosphogluconate dehydrogenase
MCAQVFDEWNKGELDSFLIEITANILRYRDEDGGYLVEKIRDTAGQVRGDKCGHHSGGYRKAPANGPAFALSTTVSR